MYNGTSAPTITVQFVKSGVWTNVASSDVKQVSIRRGRQRRDYRFDAGNLTVVLDNASGIYDPDITTGTWVVSGASIIRAGLQVRVVATWAAVPYILFAGLLESNSVDQGFEPTVTLRVVDGLALLGKAYAPPISVTKMMSLSAYHVGEQTNVRVARMLDLVNWPTADRAISSSTVTMQGTAEGDYVINIINDCAACDVGDFFVSRDGKATYRVIADKFTVPTRLEFSDVRPQPSNTIEYDSVTTEPGTLQLVNQAVVTWSQSSPVYTATFTASASAYGVQSMQVNAPSNTAAHAKKVSYLLARMNADPATRLTSVSFAGFALGALYPDFLSLELLDQVTVNRTTVDGRTLQWNVVVEGMDHDISPDDWRVTLYTSPMNPYTLS